MVRRIKAKLLKQIDDEKRASLIMSRMHKQINKQQYMASISFKKLWESEMDNIASKKTKVQDIIPNQLKLEVHDTYKKDEKITTKFKPVNAEDVINKAYPVEIFFKNRRSYIIIRKKYNQFKTLSKKQPTEEVLVQRVAETTIQILYDKGFFDNYNIANEVLKTILFTRRKTDLEQNK